MIEFTEDELERNADALRFRTDEPDARWNYRDPLGSQIVITFKFTDTVPDNFATEFSDSTYRSLPEYLREIARSVLQEVEGLTRITFVESPDLADSAVDILINGSTGGGGMAYFPPTYGRHQTHGNMVIGIGEENSDSLVSSGYDVVGDGSFAGFRETFAHELGHALGLSHPRDYSDGGWEGGSSDDYTVAIPVEMDNSLYTVMSYAGPGDRLQWQKGFAYLDILTLQFLYGKGAAGLGDTVYTFQNLNPGSQTIWDAGGTDAIDVSNMQAGTTIDLRIGSISGFGQINITSDWARGYQAASTRTLVIGPDTVIENVIGSQFADFITGNSAANVLEGRGGDDLIIGGVGPDAILGGDGIDTASYAGDEGGVFVNLTLGRGYGNASFGDTYDSIENVIGSAYDDFLIGDPGANRLDGGAGNDTIIGAVGGDWLVGGDGADLLSFEDNSGVVFVDLMARQGFNNAAQGDTYEGFENIIGGLFDDTLIGDDGANRLDGALGADTLVGHGGADVFVFSHAPGAASGFESPNSTANVDTIFDFVTGEDKLEIDADAFGGGLARGMLDPSAFVLGTQAQDADDRFIYDQATGRLYFDADGSGAGEQVLVALFPNLNAVAATDFVIAGP
tara:strand:+ start:638 stop:2503 length:1866 start_codon:yes stop_codon:yes gene_type:complete